MTVLNLQQIQSYLPHRYPFLLLDRVDAVEVGKFVQAHKAVTGNEAFFQGHFPGNPVFPGVLQLEAMGQAGVLLAILSGAPVSDSVSIYAGGIDKCRFRRPVLPGDCLTLHAELVKQRMGTYRLDCRSEVGGELASSATITVSTGPSSQRPALPSNLPPPIYGTTDST